MRPMLRLHDSNPESSACRLSLWKAVLLLSVSSSCFAQATLHGRSPDPPQPGAGDAAAAGCTVTDPRSQVSFQLPAGWNLSREDGELSTFHLDATTAPAAARMSLVAQLGSNPYPLSTFSGALFYLSATAHSTAAECAAQTTAKPAVAMGTSVVGDQTFQRGGTMHGRICTEARDTIYTALHKGSCVRFDLVINSFCGGEVSGARDLTEDQLAALRKRLEDILQTVRFEGH